MTTQRHQATADIANADLTPATAVVAIKLLAMADEAHGYLALTWEDLIVISGVATVGAARRHLSRLQALDVIHYSTNEVVYVTFRAWTRRQRIVDAPLADHPRAVGGACDTDIAATNDPLADHPRAASGSLVADNLTNDPLADHPRAASGSFGHTGLVGIDQDPIPGKDFQKPNQPKPVLVPVGDIARSLALLKDPEVDIADRQAERLARTHTFDWILRQTFAWLEDKRAGKVDKAGALVSRLDKAFAPGDLTERDRASPLYRRHVSEAEDRERAAARYVPDEFASIINT